VRQLRWFLRLIWCPAVLLSVLLLLGITPWFVLHPQRGLGLAQSLDLIVVSMAVRLALQWKSAFASESFMAIPSEVCRMYPISS